MTELENKATSAADPTPVLEVPPKAAQQWLGYVSPVVQRLRGAVLDTRSTIENRLGFCPLKVLARGASERLDVLAGGLQRIATLLRNAAGVEPDSQANGGESPTAQA